MGQTSDQEFVVHGAKAILGATVTRVSAAEVASANRDKSGTILPASTGGIGEVPSFPVLPFHQSLRAEGTGLYEPVYASACHAAI